MTKKICVIGAGIVGISVALKLSQQGHQVTVLDREGVASEASQGNAGAFAFTDVLPLASPGIMRNAPKWLLDPLGPLSVSPKYALQIAPWLFRFWRASWPDRHEASLQAQTQLMALAKAALERQIADNKAEHMIRREGQPRKGHLSLTEAEGPLSHWLASKSSANKVESLGTSLRYRHRRSSGDPRHDVPDRSS